MSIKKIFGISALAISLLWVVLYASSWHSLDKGEHAVSRDFWGTTKVVLESGPFFSFMGDVEIYTDASFDESIEHLSNQ